MHGMGGHNRQGVYDGKIAGLYDLEETLGSGHFAVVKLARHVFTGEKVAVKVIDKTKLDEVSRAHLFQEVRCMKLVQHPNVVRLYEVIDTQTKLYLILELGDGGDLYDYIMKHEGGLSENLARKYFQQIMRAISYCHQLHVVHRDLKPENVVFFEKLGMVKLTDFGFSNKFCPGQKLETSCGSLAYSAPEILLGDSYDAPAVDVWSLGVILYMLVCGQPPFQEANDSETLTMIMDCKYIMPAHVSDGCRRLIGTMLVREPEKRATLQQIAQDSWLHDGGKPLDQISEYSPLVSRTQLSEEDHTFIIQKMVNGNIASKEEILEALDRNDYNHISATYFLLAERKLRENQEPSRLSPGLKPNIVKTSLQNQQKLTPNKVDSDKDARNFLAAPVSTSGLLNIPRAAGDIGQTSRSRKCSIVQEEDDEEELSSCSGREDLSAPLNRRGSRSEGRLNVAVQDRVAEAERIKTKDTLSKVIDGISGVKIISKDTNNTVERLGAAGRGGVTVRPQDQQHHPHHHHHHHPHRLVMKMPKFNDKEQSSSSTSAEKNLTRNISNKDAPPDKKIFLNPMKIPRPLTSTGLVKPITTNFSETATVLNEIAEEGTDVKVPSASQQPLVQYPKNARQTFFAETQDAVGDMVVIMPTGKSASTSRRAQFNKTRTASCSSSDASDDDSENRKKRAHKIVDVGKPLQQRRDSHDDSSDSQDPGNSTATGNNRGNSTQILDVTTTTSTTDSTQNSSQDTSDQHKSTGGRQNNIQQICGYRKHRSGRRLTGETRLRESQSLNRITEVHECDQTTFSTLQPQQLVKQVVTTTTTNAIVSTVETTNNTTTSKIVATEQTTSSTTATTTNNNNKSKFLGVRLLQGFRKHNIYLGPLDKQQRVPALSDTLDDYNVEIMLSEELTKALRVPDATSTSTSKNQTDHISSSSSTKKLKILGKYFQVHKKMCIPIPGIFLRGRLYKAQSCGSIVKDRVNQQNTTGGGGSAKNSRHSTISVSSSGGGSTGQMLSNCIRTSNLLGSDGALNQNNEQVTIKPPTNLFTIMSSSSSSTSSSSSKKCSISKTTSSIHHQTIGEKPLCSKC